MKTRKVTMEFNGLGFPVILVKAPMRMTGHGEALDIDPNHLQSSVFEALIRKPARLSGAEVRFIRNFMEMTQNVFADFLSTDRSSVAKWEAKDLAPTGMTPAIEALLRMQMVRHLKHSLDKEFAFIEPAIRKKEVGKPIELAMV